MKNKNSILDVDYHSKQMIYANVIRVQNDGTILVNRRDELPVELYCNALQTSEGMAINLVPGDVVLVLLPESDEERGVVLGRIGPSRASAVEPEKTKDTPDELVIEAKKNLTFKCGDGSITMRKDGKILIKGKDLVSRAKRMNRIKGGSVAIN